MRKKAVCIDMQYFRGKGSRYCSVWLWCNKKKISSASHYDLGVELNNFWLTNTWLTGRHLEVEGHISSFCTFFWWLFTSIIGKLYPTLVCISWLIFAVLRPNLCPIAGSDQNQVVWGLGTGHPNLVKDVPAMAGRVDWMMFMFPYDANHSEILWYSDSMILWLTSYIDYCFSMTSWFCIYFSLGEKSLSLDSNGSPSLSLPSPGNIEFFFWLLFCIEI